MKQKVTHFLNRLVSMNSLLPYIHNSLTRLSLRVHLFAAKFRVQHVRGSLSLSTGIQVGAARALILKMIRYEERNI